MSPVGFLRRQEGVSCSGANRRCGPAHRNTNNFAPNEYREVVNLSGLAVYKGSNTRVEIVVATERKVKAVNWNGVNYDGNMDRGPMIFTSDVSLPKDENNHVG